MVHFCFSEYIAGIRALTPGHKTWVLQPGVKGFDHGDRLKRFYPRGIGDPNEAGDAIQTGQLQRRRPAGRPRAER